MPLPHSVLLVTPPVCKPSEPSPGIARLAGALRAGGIGHGVWDANIEGLHWLMAHPRPPADTWSRRAARNLDSNLNLLGTQKGYAHPDRYKRAVMDLNRVLWLAGRDSDQSVSLSDYKARDGSPVNSRDLIRAAEAPGSNLFYPFFRSRLSQLAASISFDILGVSINFMSQAICAFALIGVAKALFPRLKIVIGGGLVTSWLAKPGIANPFSGLVDELVRGPGEEALSAMCREIAVSDVPPLPFGFDFGAFAWRGYISPVRILPINTARGCYWRKCRFCPESAERMPYCPEAPARVFQNIRHLKAALAPGLIHFVDNALSPRFLEYMAKHPPGLPWYGFVRITRHLEDPEFVQNLKDSGCVMLKLGIESGDQRVLDALDKGLDIESAARVLETVKSAGIATYVYLLFGTPPENETGAEKTLNFTLQHAEAITYLNLAIFNLPESATLSDCVSTSSFYDGDLSLYREFHHPNGWNRDRVRRFLARRFRSQPLIREISKRVPPFFTSNHAPLFHLPF